METAVYFQSGEYTIEGLLCRQSDEKAAIITHPHPLYGGDMYNYVVESVKKTYQDRGYTTLRFNFRGVGASQGNFDDGKGEKIDLLSAATYLKKLGTKYIDLAGYSFGAWIAAQVASIDDHFQKVILISPPVSFIDFQNISSIPNLILVVVGSNDEYASSVLIRKLLPDWNRTTRLEIIEGADHFFQGQARNLENLIKAVIKT